MSPARGPLTQSEFDGWYQSGAGQRLLMSTGETPRYDAILRQLAARRQAAPLRILDAGCGNGRLAALLPPAERSRYLGVDFSRAAIEAARTLVPTAKFLVADLRAWRPLIACDVIVFNEVTYYLPDPREMVARYAPALAPGGCLVVSVFRPAAGPRHWQTLQAGFSVAAAAVAQNDAGLTWDVKTLLPSATSLPSQNTG